MLTELSLHGTISPEEGVEDSLLKCALNMCVAIPRLVNRADLCSYIIGSIGLLEISHIANRIQNENILAEHAMEKLKERNNAMAKCVLCLECEELLTKRYYRSVTLIHRHTQWSLLKIKYIENMQFSDLPIKTIRNFNMHFKKYISNLCIYGKGTKKAFNLP